jgi:hypothetical protein
MAYQSASAPCIQGDLLFEEEQLERFCVANQAVVLIEQLRDSDRARFIRML